MSGPFHLREIPLARTFAPIAAIGHLIPGWQFGACERTHVNQPGTPGP